MIPTTMSTHDHSDRIPFSFAEALCELEEERLGAGTVITLIVGLCCFFGCCFQDSSIGLRPHPWDLLLCITGLI